MQESKRKTFILFVLTAAIIALIASPSGAQQAQTRVYMDSSGKPIAVEAIDPATGQEVTNYTYKAADGSVVPHVSELDPAMRDLLKKSSGQEKKVPESSSGITKSAPPRISEGSFSPYAPKAHTGSGDKMRQYRHEMWGRVHAEGARRMARQGPKVPLSRTGLYPVSALTGIQP